MKIPQRLVQLQRRFFAAPASVLLPFKIWVCEQAFDVLERQVTDQSVNFSNYRKCCHGVTLKQYQGTCGVIKLGVE